ncbi:tyrosine-protein kinase transmembrane receptor Ror [Biomphalaria pfeifferi]|uniref:Tyrosine-protein kinase transmembrane receptor Ror n=1 Tax=Biomphalaria pfeifferi TaxID=112525 RepID=A0AAD8BLF4_BIOPF|nr:tyrosine-protein kinase transmembrane receptor Ror [Biomphalaria pfeifferi]
MYLLNGNYLYFGISACFILSLNGFRSSTALAVSPKTTSSRRLLSKNSKESEENTDVDTVKNVSYSFNISTCSVQIDGNNTSVINLKALAREDGFPRFYTQFNVSTVAVDKTWEYSFNPCFPVNLPPNNIHAVNLYGDGCYSVLLCKHGYQSSRLYYFPLGINDQDKVEVKVKKENDTPIITLKFTGIKSMRSFKSHVKLICDRKRTNADDGLFTVEMDNGQNMMMAELRHLCCCPGACSANGTNLPKKKDAKVGADGELTLIIVGTLVSLILFVALIGGLCYVKRTHLQFYYKLPAINPSGTNNTSIYPSLNGKPSPGQKNSDFRDYEPASISSARKKMIPVLADCKIKMEHVEMGQRLGGGIFGDTHLAKWNEMTVTVKRLTLAIHDNQLTSETMEWMEEEVWFLSRQRHKNIVCILGLCLNGRLPFLLTEYVIGECLKDFLKVNGKLLTWPQRVRLCSQVADGMAFLHSTKPQIIHRDLRCGNLFLSDNDLVKVADFGLTKLLQPMREQCNSDDCGCQRQLSACPATVRWTAPEILTHPKTKEGENGIITTACDVYSFGMVMWELVHCKDPFDEIGTELEVIEIVRNGGRPDTPPSYEMMPHYKDLMKTCWDQRPNTRPQFKHVAVKLKELITHARSYQKQVSSKSRTPKLNDTIVQV